MSVELIFGIIPGKRGAWHECKIAVSHDYQRVPIGIMQEDMDQFTSEVNEGIGNLRLGPVGACAYKLGMVPCLLPCFFWNMAATMRGGAEVTSLINQRSNEAVGKWQAQGINVRFEPGVYRLARNHNVRGIRKDPKFVFEVGVEMQRAPDDPTEKLLKLKGLLDAGALTQDEYDEKKGLLLEKL